MALQLLTVGDNPNLAFYAWRLQSTKACFVTVVSPNLDSSAPIHWQSDLLGDDVFTPNMLVPSVSHVDPSKKFDIVLLSVPNLQSFQDSCAAFTPYLHSKSLIVVESTGYVQLEPFVVSSFPKSKRWTVCSIMNEAEIKRFPESNTFVHDVLDHDQRLYLGTCSEESKSSHKVASSETYSNFYKLLQMVQEQSSGAISLLRSNNHSEFMTYQWKLALPRIVLNPLSVIFEEPYPADLGKQILAKPLITGLVNEVFKIIKKMGCKLIKGYENEANISKNWSAHYRGNESDALPEFCCSNPVFYNFFHQMDIDIDLLLLQPILLGDDHGVRTPYLENLYSILCQLLKMNSSGQSMLFTRKLPGSDEKVKDINKITDELDDLKLERDNVESQFRDKLTQVKQLETSLAQKQQMKEALQRKFEDDSVHFDNELKKLEALYHEKQSNLESLDNALKQRMASLETLESKISNMTYTYEQQQQQQQQRNMPSGEYNQQKSTAPTAVNGEENVSGSPKQNGHSESSNSKTIDYSQMQTPDLSDFAHVAMYGAVLNGDIPPIQPTNAAPPDAQKQADMKISERERILEQRERALLERERGMRSQVSLTDRGEYFYDSHNGEPSRDGSGYSQMSNGVSRGNYGNYGYMHGNGSQSNGDYNGGNHFNGNANANYQENNFNQPIGMPRHSYSLTGINPYNQQFEQYGYDPRQPQGLQPNGFARGPQQPMPRNQPRSQPNGPGPQYQMPQYRPNRASQSNLLTAQNYQQPMPNQIGPNQNQMVMNQQPPMQQMTSSQYLLSQSAQTGGSAFTARKQNRRSGYPDQALNIDYGGRGGMPMPAAGSKHRSVMAMQGTQSAPQIHQSKKSVSVSYPSASHLQPPAQHGSSNSDSLTSHGSNEESPKPPTPDSQKDIRIEVPSQSEISAKPLGAVAVPVDDKKKKRGFLKKH